MNPEKWARIHLRLRPRRVRPGGTFSNSVGTSPCVGENLTVWWCACISQYEITCHFLWWYTAQSFCPLFAKVWSRIGIGLFYILEIKNFGLGSRIWDIAEVAANISLWLHPWNYLSSKQNPVGLQEIFEKIVRGEGCVKVHIFWEGHKILRNLHRR